MKYTIQQVYDNHDKYIDKILNKYIFNRQLHKDFKQEIYINLMKSLPKKDFNIELKVVVHLAVKWYCMDYLNSLNFKGRRNVFYLEDNKFLENDIKYSTKDTYNFDKSRILKYIKQLPLNQQQIINMYFFDGMWIKDIAKKLGVRNSYCYDNKVSALRKLRKSVKIKEFI